MKMQTDSKEKSISDAQRLFSSENFERVGHGFYRYTEPIKDEMISRKGLEREASIALGLPLTLVTRNDVQCSLSSFARQRAGLNPATERISVLQLTSDYERDQQRSITAKATRLQSKYSK